MVQKVKLIGRTNCKTYIENMKIIVTLDIWVYIYKNKKLMYLKQIENAFDATFLNF